MFTQTTFEQTNLAPEVSVCAQGAPNALLIAPHSGNAIPDDVRALMRRASGLDDAQLARVIVKGGDLFSGDVFAIAARTRIRARASRYLLDPNRRYTNPIPDPRVKPPMIFRRETFDGKPFYDDAFVDAFLADRVLQDEWVARFHAPFHTVVQAAIDIADHACLIDCHTMSKNAESGKGTTGAARVAIVLSNRGDAQGEEAPTRAGQLTCEPETLRALRTLAEAHFAHAFEGTGIPFHVALNSPFPGGYSIREYCGTLGKRLHMRGFALEINEGQYMDYETLLPIPERLTAIQQCAEAFVAAAVTLF